MRLPIVFRVQFWEKVKDFVFCQTQQYLFYLSFTLFIVLFILVYFIYCFIYFNLFYLLFILFHFIMTTRFGQLAVIRSPLHNLEKGAKPCK